MKIKKRLPKRKDAIEPEEIQNMLQDRFTTARHSIEKYRSAALASVAVLIILCVTGGVYYYLSQKWDKEASSLEGKAYHYFVEGDYQKALSAYQTLVDDYSGSDSAPVAVYYLGNSHLNLGQTDQAIQAYQKFIEEYRGNDALLPLVYLNLAHAYMDKKDYSRAIASFKEISTMKNSLAADRMVYEAGRAYEVSGDMTSAVERYQHLVQTYPASPWSQMASSRLNKGQGAAPEARPPQDKP